MGCSRRLGMGCMPRRAERRRIVPDRRRCKRVAGVGKGRSTGKAKGTVPALQLHANPLLARYQAKPRRSGVYSNGALHSAPHSYVGGKSSVLGVEEFRPHDTNLEVRRIVGIRVDNRLACREAAGVHPSPPGTGEGLFVVVEGEVIDGRKADLAYAAQISPV